MPKKPRDISHAAAMALINEGVIPSGKHRGKSASELNRFQRDAIVGALTDPNRRRWRTFDGALVEMLRSTKVRGGTRQAKPPIESSKSPNAQPTPEPRNEGIGELPESAVPHVIDAFTSLSYAARLCKNDEQSDVSRLLKQAMGLLSAIADPDPTNVPFECD